MLGSPARRGLHVVRRTHAPPPTRPPLAGPDDLPRRCSRTCTASAACSWAPSRAPSRRSTRSCAPRCWGAGAAPGPPAIHSPLLSAGPHAVRGLQRDRGGGDAVPLPPHRQERHGLDVANCSTTAQRGEEPRSAVPWLSARGGTRRLPSRCVSPCRRAGLVAALQGRHEARV